MDEQAVSDSQGECSGYSGILGVSEDSDEDLILEPLLNQSWEEFPILERLGLSSCEEMTEEEVEHAFGQCALAFQCDQCTLTQRLLAEEHDRTVALENLRLELQNTRDTLQLLCERLMDGQVREIVKQMEGSLQTLENSMENIITAAENLGSTHQDARLSHAVELMVLHMKNLKKRHSIEKTELLHTRKLLQSTRGRLLSDSTEDGEVKQSTGDRQLITRRRVSITLIPTQNQLTDLEVKFLENRQSGEHLDTQEGSGVKCERRQGTCTLYLYVVLPVDGSAECSPTINSKDLFMQAANEKFRDDQDEDPDSPQQVTLRCRGSALLKSDQSSEERESLSKMTERTHDPAGIQSKLLVCVLQQPLQSWLSHCRRALMSVLILCGTFTLLLLLLLYLRAPLYRT